MRTCARNADAPRATRRQNHSQTSPKANWPTNPGARSMHATRQREASADLPGAWFERDSSIPTQTAADLLQEGFTLGEICGTAVRTFRQSIITTGNGHVERCHTVMRRFGKRPNLERPTMDLPVARGP